VQLDPIKPKLKPPRTKRLKLECDELLSIFAFNFNLRRFMMGSDLLYEAHHAAVLPAVIRRRLAAGGRCRVVGRGLHSSASQLNLSRF